MCAYIYVCVCVCMYNLSTDSCRVYSMFFPQILLGSSTNCRKVTNILVRSFRKDLIPVHLHPK